MGEHFVQVYKSFARELGTDSVDGVDPAGIVGRLYMEYCEDGDMWRSALSATRGVVDPPWPIPEEYIWRAFECLGNAAWMLDIEDIIHFDLKPNNSEYLPQQT
jgi:hypothetical protein